MFNFIKRKHKPEFLKYSFINNSILLRMDTIIENGYKEVWRQSYRKDYGYGEDSVQILCYNEKKEEFQAFDRYQRPGEGDPYSPLPRLGYDLWTPIKLHYTLEWLRDNLRSIEK